MDAALNKTISEILYEYYATGFFTHAHCLAGSITSGEIYSDVSIAKDGAQIFDLASITKAVCTAPLIYRLMLKLKIDPETAKLEQLFKTWPQRLNNHFKSIHVKKLLRHESGLPAWRNFWMCRLGSASQSVGREERANEIINKFNKLLPEALNLKPAYSDMGFILLGLALESFYDRDLADLFSEFAAPAYNAGSVINFPVHIKSGAIYVPSAFCPIRSRMLNGEVHDENSASLGGQTGHAGVFGTVYGLAAILRSMFQDKVDRAFLELNANHIIASDLSQKPNESLFGWRQGADRSASGYAQGKSMGHLGFTGTAFWVDWTEKRFAILLTNRVISGRVNRATAEVRSRVFAALN
jgi:CubicO group peptidase (beta-lactamase class C family)